MWYHASPTRYSPGDLIHGKSQGWSFKTPVVFMTESDIPHYTIFERAVKENWFVYQVKPLRKVKIGTCWDEAGCELVEVVKKVGNARGIARKDKREQKGSMVRWKYYVNARLWFRKKDGNL